MILVEFKEGQNRHLKDAIPRGFKPKQWNTLRLVVDRGSRTFRNHKAKYDRFDWNTYRIDVDGKRVTGFVNGKKVWSTSGAVRPLDGHVGCWVQEQSVEIRKFNLIDR